jgi:glycine/D-amino acid oxidase-like deaminating enzyme
MCEAKSNRSYIQPDSINMSVPEAKNIVVIGGGIIGSCTAYFLAHHPAFNPAVHRITLLEATKIAGGASGKAGGLLALWAYPKAIVPLSFRLHRELAEKYDGAKRWGYRGVFAGQINVQVESNHKATVNKDESEVVNEEKISLQKRSKEALALLKSIGVPNDLDWVDARGVKSYDYMGDPENTAQVHPYLFTTSMADLAEEKGVKIVIGSAKRIEKSANKVASVVYVDKATGEDISLLADTVVLAAGAWCSNLMPEAPITPLERTAL